MHDSVEGQKLAPFWKWEKNKYREEKLHIVKLSISWFFGQDFIVGRKLNAIGYETIQIGVARLDIH